MTARDTAAGLTLVEMLVALVLFALVGLASFTTLDAIIRTRDRTEGRLEQIARYDRALLLLTRDVMQSVPQSITVEEGRLSLSTSEGFTLTWSILDAVVQRSAGRPGEAPYITQQLLNDVAGLQFRVLDDGLSWSDVWPADNVDMTLRAVEMTVNLTGARGSLVRLVETTSPVPERSTFDINTGTLSETLDPVDPPAVPIAPEGN